MDYLEVNAVATCVWPVTDDRDLAASGRTGGQFRAGPSRSGAAHGRLTHGGYREVQAVERSRAFHGGADSLREFIAFKGTGLLQPVAISAMPRDLRYTSPGGPGDRMSSPISR